MHLSGIGHIKRMLTLASSLLDSMEITFIQAGRDELGPTIKHPRFRHLILPLTKEMKEQFLRPFESKEVTLESMKMRKKLLFTHLDFSQPFDFILTEQIPFTKLFYWGEVLSIISGVKQVNPHAAVICSLKGARFNRLKDVSEKERASATQYDKQIVEIVSRYYDRVLIHTDPKLFRLEEFVLHCEPILDKVVYTGLIAKKPTRLPQVVKKEKKIIVSIGAGLRGLAVIQAVLQVVDRFPDHQFVIVKGPLSSWLLQKALKGVPERHSNVKIVEFIHDFCEELNSASLAITLAGSTLVDLYISNVPALVYCSPDDRGQVILGRRFEEEGIVRLIRKEDFSKDTLEALIQKTMDNPPSSTVELSIQGVENSRREILSTLQHRG